MENTFGRTSTNHRIIHDSSKIMIALKTYLLVMGAEQWFANNTLDLANRVRVLVSNLDPLMWPYINKSGRLSE